MEGTHGAGEEDSVFLTEDLVGGSWRGLFIELEICVK